MGAGVGDPLGDGEAPVVVVVVAGDIAVVAGVVPGTGEMPGAVAAGATAAGLVVVIAGDIAGIAGLVAGTTGALAAGLVAGGPPGGRLTGDVGGGGGWPNEVSARVTEQRLAISSVFIG
ncbi:MAG: hypothetical protein QOG51_1595 [Verrucomicrobiota bacterium]